MVLEADASIGGQPQKLYPFKTILDIPAYSQIKAEDLINELSHNINRDTRIKTNEPVQYLAKSENGFILNGKFEVKSIIIATGNGAFKPKKLPLKLNPNVENRIHYYFKDPTIFKNQNIGIFGGGDSALDWALELANICNVALVHRRDNFRGLESSVNKLQSLKNVQILTPYLPKDIQLNDNKLNVHLREVGSSNFKDISFDQILVAYGFKANNNFVKNWGIHLKQSRIEVDFGMRTNIDGIYAIGDVVNYPKRIPVIGVGFGEAQIAINSIMNDLFPDKSLTIHSTSL